MKLVSLKRLLLCFVGMICTSIAAMILNDSLRIAPLISALASNEDNSSMETFLRNLKLAHTLYGLFNCVLISVFWSWLLTKNGDRQFYMSTLALTMPGPFYLMAYPGHGEVNLMACWLAAILAGEIVGYINFVKSSR